MREVDRLVIEEFAILLEQMMENVAATLPLSAPPALYERLGLTYRSPFGRGPVVEVQRSPAGRTLTA